MSQLGPPDGRREEPPEPEETPLDKLVTWLMPKERVSILRDTRDYVIIVHSRERVRDKYLFVVNC